MHHETQAQRYLATRRWYPNVPAAFVLEVVRGEQLNDMRGRRIVPRTFGPPRLIYNPRIADAFGWLTERRWIENTAQAGLRFVGYADELARLDHRGWYTDPHGEIADEVYRGAIWQLPARHGQPVYVYGFVDPHNEGAALIDFDYELGADGEDRDAMRDAAHYANEVARIEAEKEREYREKAEARLKLENELETVRERRGEHSRLITELRKFGHNKAPVTVGALDSYRFELREEVSVSISRIRDLLSEHGDEILSDEFA